MSPHTFAINSHNRFFVCWFAITIGLHLLDLKAFSQDAPAKPSGTEKAESKPLGLDLPTTKPTGPVDPDTALKEMGYQDPIQKVIATLAEPPNAKRISKKSSLWIDVKHHRVFLDGYVSLRDAPLEMFACPAGTKEHESIVATLARSSEVHAALLAVGAMSGTTVKFDPKYVAATGQRVRVWVLYRDADGKFKYADARSWVRQGETDKALEMDWVFAGSVNWTDPQDGKNYYQADGGELICVSNFGTAMMDLPIESSDSNSSLSFMAYTKRIPPDLTPVRLMLVPIPIPSDQPADPNKTPNPEQAPDESLLPLNPVAVKPAK
jgi:hypothetical protein